MTTVSVILPVYNEEDNLRSNLKNLENFLSGQLKDFEIIVSEDGSTDDTCRIVNLLKSKRIRILNNRERLGKGAAIKAAVAHAKGEIIVFIDADLISAPSQITELVYCLESDADVVIASRYHKNSRTKRGLIRHFASKCYNWSVKFAFGSKINDHQCGLKAFRKSKVADIMDKIGEDKWFFDTEFLIRAQRKGLRILEVPIVWNEGCDSKLRLVEDAAGMGFSLLKFRLKSR